MQTLANVCVVNRSFQKSKRIDTDLVPEGIEGYRLNASGWQVLCGFAEDIARSKQRAFTWTGPYGSGKSSLALLLSAALSPRGALRGAAVDILGENRADIFYDLLPCPDLGWMVVGVVGRRAGLVSTLWESLGRATRDRWGAGHPLACRLAERAPTLTDLTEAFAEVARTLDSEGAGLLLLVDEMGKFLEHAALADGDLFPLQEIAETFGRLPHRCVLLGVLHQAFGDYGRRAGAGLQAEWSKIQGRFNDTPFSIGIDEVVGLIAAALGDRPPAAPEARRLADAIAAALRGGRLGSADGLAGALARCAPLHPVTALLLGPVSRRRFGQNERSVFSFLCSHEPGGFAEFLVTEPAGSGRLYGPSALWEYLQLNHEPAILASPDGARWAEAAEAVLRVTRRPGSTGTHVALTKAIGLLDLFGRPYGIPASDELLAACVGSEDDAGLAPVLEDLKTWSVAIPRRHIGGWGLFAGSDIDLDEVAARAAERIAGDPTAILSALRDLPPVVAKRHYAETGSLRLFERRVVRGTEVGRVVSSPPQEAGATGRFLLVLPEQSIEGGQAELFLPEPPKDQPVFLAVLKHESRLVQAARDVAALERVPTMVPQLHGDPVARRELNGRLLAARAALAAEAREAFDGAEWRSALSEVDQRVGAGGLSALASRLCHEVVFSSAPCIHNELINRDRPSPSAVAARRRLLNAMVEAKERPRLGIEGEPAELGLYLSLLAATGIHREVSKTDRLGFLAPAKDRGLEAAWAAAENLLKDGSNRRGVPVTFERIYDLWRTPPYGIREGVLPVLALALYLANAEAIAVYVEGNFVPDPKAAFIDRLLQSPGDVGLRWIQADEVSADALGRIASFAEGAKLASGVAPTALEVAKPLVQFALRLSGWARRTKSLTAETIRVRDALLEATDPYLLLFRTLPAACGLKAGSDTEIASGWTTRFIERLGIAVEELRSAQGALLDRFRKQVGRAMHADLAAQGGTEELAQRAASLRRHALDLRLARFAQIVAGAASGGDWVEALCSLAANRPMRDWTDGDADRCAHELERLCRRFAEAEAARAVAEPEGHTLHEAAMELRTQLANRGLDRSQQRVALLLALEQLAPNSSEQEAA